MSTEPFPEFGTPVERADFFVLPRNKIFTYGRTGYCSPMTNPLAG
jgi:hypothetical protein